jgi:DNA-binding GntR family transcriptional regulator
MEAYAVRSELEALGARLAVPRITDADLADLMALGDEMQRAAQDGDRHAVAIADAGLHGRIVQIAGNATLERVWRALEPFSRTYITLLVPGADAHWTADLHTPILEALRRRDTELVVQALRRHFATAGARLGEEWADPEPEAARDLPASSVGTA